MKAGRGVPGGSRQRGAAGKIFEVRQLTGNAAGEVVGGEEESFEVGSVCQFGGNRTAQVVISEVERLEHGQAAQFRGD